MKQFLIMCACTITLVASVNVTAQVGVGTTNPQETLHVNGTLRITTTDQVSVNTVKIGGLDENGTFREITIGTNLILEDNVLQATSNPVYTFGSITFTVEDINDANLLLGPGEDNYEKNIIRVFSSMAKAKITGIKAGVHGQMIWLSPQPGVKLELETENGSSVDVNRILIGSHRKAEYYEMIQLVYDAVRERWIMMNWHSN